MKEVVINGYVKVEPVSHETFFVSQKETYEEIGVVVAKDESVDIPIGARVYFDSYMAKKYPIKGQEGKYQWFVHKDEIIKYEIEEISK